MEMMLEWWCDNGDDVRMVVLIVEMMLDWLC